MSEFEKAPQPARKKEGGMDTSWVDLAEGNLDTPANPEVSSEQIEAAEARVTASSAHLKEAMTKPVNEKEISEPDTWEKINDAWERAKLRAMEVFTGLFAASVGTTIWLGETQQAAEAAIRDANLENNINLLERVSLLQTTDTVLLTATLSVPLVMLGISKLSTLRREKELYSSPNA